MVVEVAAFGNGRWPGVARRLVTFFCFAKRKSPKKRRPAVWVPALRSGQPALLDSGGGPQNSLRSNNCGPDPASICAARPSQDGTIGMQIPNTKTNKDTPWRVLVGFGLRYLAACLQPPSVCAEERRARRIRDRDCLSEASSSETPPGPSTAGCPQRSGGTQAVGSPFFSLGFFGEAKKSKSPAGATPGLRPQLASTLIELGAVSC